MHHTRQRLRTPDAWVAANQPDHPALFYAETTLRETASQFRAAFPGEVTYAVKANPDLDVLKTLASAGISAFDVASPAEMAAVRGVRVDARLHYNNPVRSPAEIAAGIRSGVVSWSVDHLDELAKLDGLDRRAEIAVRFALPVRGAAYDFGDKFGATPDQAAKLLRAAAEAGFTPALCFHPGTQCASPTPWIRYVEAAARIANTAGVRLARLNVGGGFAAHRAGMAPDLAAIFSAVGTAVTQAFGQDGPDLLCEPGRSMVAESGTLALRIKAVRDGAIYLNDGLYGTLADLRDMSPPDRVQVIAPDGTPRHAAHRLWETFGPTCDSLDRLPDGWFLPADLHPGDFLIIRAMGAYSAAMATNFNGYGAATRVWL